MKIVVEITISPQGQMTVDVKGAKGPVCMDVLEQLEALVGEASQTQRKPEYELDVEVLEALRDQGVRL